MGPSCFRDYGGFGERGEGEGGGGLKVAGEVSSHWSTAQVTELAQPVGENKHNKHVFIPGVVRHQSKQPSTTKQKSLTENYGGCYSARN